MSNWKVGPEVAWEGSFTNYFLLLNIARVWMDFRSNLPQAVPNVGTISDVRHKTRQNRFNTYEKE